MNIPGVYLSAMEAMTSDLGGRRTRRFREHTLDKQVRMVKQAKKSKRKMSRASKKKNR